MKLALVTVLFNSNEYLDGFFQSLAIQTFTDFELYLIDNTPSEDSFILISSLLEKYQLTDKTHYINSGGNVGVAAGNNLGIKAALNTDADAIILLNNDIEFYDNSLLHVLAEKALSENLIIPKMYYFDKKNIIWCAGGDFILSKGLTTHYGEDELDAGQYEKEVYVRYAPTCFMLIKREVFTNVGLMDEKYFVYFDDTDFLYRCLNKYKILFMPNLKIFHKVSSSTGGNDSPFTIKFGHRNRIYFSVKNLPFFYKVSSICYLFFSVMIKYIIFNGKQRQALINGIQEGIKLVI